MDLVVDQLPIQGAADVVDRRVAGDAHLPGLLVHLHAGDVDAEHGPGIQQRDTSHGADRPGPSGALRELHHLGQRDGAAGHTLDANLAARQLEVVGRRLQQRSGRFQDLAARLQHRLLDGRSHAVGGGAATGPRRLRRGGGVGVLDAHPVGRQAEHFGGKGREAGVAAADVDRAQVHE